MTPLAHFMAKDLTLPVKRRRSIDKFSLNVARRLSGAHCFELTSVNLLIEDLARKIAYEGHEVGPLGFLPASKTWIEWHEPPPHGQRIGILLESFDAGRRATFTECAFCGDYTDEQIKRMACGELVNPADIGTCYSAGEGNNNLLLYCNEASHPGWTPLPADVIEGCKDFSVEDFEAWERWVPALVFASLALINSPRVIGRRQHMPHRGLEKKLVAQKKLIGKFPLHAWTEIKLEINVPLDLAGEPSTEAHLTGERALHFCRAHLRVRFGKLEIVSAHWRGNPALGIKQSRYKLVEARA